MDAQKLDFKMCVYLLPYFIIFICGSIIYWTFFLISRDSIRMRDANSKKVYFEVTGWFASNFSAIIYSYSFHNIGKTFFNWRTVFLSFLSYLVSYSFSVKINKKLLECSAVETQYKFSANVPYDNLRMEQIMVLQGTPIECF